MDFSSFFFWALEIFLPIIMLASELLIFYFFFGGGSVGSPVILIDVSCRVVNL